MKPRPVTHVIFDMDGLLLSTEPIYTQVTQEVVSRYGKEFNWSIKSRMIGRGREESSQILIQALDLPLSVDELYRQQLELFLRYFPLAEPMPGARELCDHLQAHGVGMAVATSSHRQLFEVKTSRHQSWFAQFDQIVMGDDPEVKACKPAPDLFLVAAQRLGAKPEDCLVFEDAPTGVEAAIKAGMQVVAVPDPAMDPGAYQGASLILSSLTQFNPAAWGLPC